MGNMIRCDRDLHYYDSKKHQSCPFCRDMNFDESVETTRAAFRVKTSTATMTSGQTEGYSDSYPNPEGRTVGIWEEMVGGSGIRPTVGWLVCIEGPNKGRDYRIFQGLNRIGRDAGKKVDIVITDDTMVSREDHAEIEYDEDTNEYFLIRKSNPEVRVNGERVREPRKLMSHDIVKLGQYEFLFVALCNEKFIWELK
jgi:hypothetical protein